VSILRELMRGVRLDPRSVTGPLDKIQAELRRSPVCIDISGLPTELLSPPIGEEHARPPFPLAWVESTSDAVPGARFAALIEAQDLATSSAHLRRVVEKWRSLEALPGGGVPGKRVADDDFTAVHDLERETAGMDGALHLRCYTSVHGGRLVGFLGDVWIPMRDGNLFQSAAAPDQAGTLKVVSVYRGIVSLEANLMPVQNNLAVMGVRVAGLYSLLNCRNVALQSAERQPEPRKREKLRRVGKLGVDWKVLHLRLPGVGTVKASGGSGAGDRLTRAHLVRGHFKTFSAEAPLFGRHTGRFWWPASVRGNAERGSVIKDYAAEASPR